MIHFQSLQTNKVNPYNYTHKISNPQATKVYNNSKHKTTDTLDLSMDINNFYEENYSFLDIDFLCNNILKLHSNNLRFPSHYSIENSSSSLQHKISVDIYSKAEEMAKQFYKKGKTFGRSGNLLSLKEFQNDIDIYLLNISKVIEDQVNLLGNVNNKKSSFRNSLDDEFIKILKEHQGRTNKSQNNSPNNSPNQKMLLHLKYSLLSNRDFIHRINKLKSFVLQNA
ncbi:hypothetical protein [Dethiothermospora halolimnae]|uniref:hypothetical protein n=1 Tax=Dethiothermospora halolimnae TaxID=3114390 RepID=UPI003CCBC67B